MIGHSTDSISGKIDLVRCDKHRTAGMRAVTTQTISPVGDVNFSDALYCKMPECNRHYRTDFGYFTQALGSGPDLELDQKKPRCGKHEETPALFVEQVGAEEWRLSCPIDGCDTQQPLES